MHIRKVVKGLGIAADTLHPGHSKTTASACIVPAFRVGQRPATGLRERVRQLKLDP